MATYLIHRLVSGDYLESFTDEAITFSKDINKAYCFLNKQQALDLRVDLPPDKYQLIELI